MCACSGLPLDQVDHGVMLPEHYHLAIFYGWNPAARDQIEPSQFGRAHDGMPARDKESLHGDFCLLTSPLMDDPDASPLMDLIDLWRPKQRTFIDIRLVVCPYAIRHRSAQGRLQFNIYRNV